MKFPLHLLLASAPQLSSAYYVSTTTSTTTTTTTPYYSSFLHHNRHHHNYRHHHHRSSSSSSSSATRLHYKEPSSNDIGDNESSDGANANANVWSVLANTERWISETLDRSNDAARAANERRDAEEAKREQLEEEQQQKKKMHFADEKQQSEDEQEKSKRKKKRLPRSDNPYARKEVTYVCETGSELASIVGGMFRRVREARELGEGHGRGVEARRENASASASAQRPPTTMRQTNVVVIPNCDELSNFHVFDGLVLAINQARRASRDFVLKREEEEKKEGGDGDQDWVVSINCAHLHPQYGTPSPDEQLRALKHEEEEGEVDLNRLEFKRRRDEARRSPYPSLIVEVQSTPPVDFGRSSSSSNGMRRDEEALEAAVEMEKTASSANNVDGDVTSDDVRKLEALFGMSAATKLADDTFYEALGEAFGDKQIASQSPLSLAQAWVLENDPAFDEATSTFTKSDTRHVDAAYEYVFNNLAMLDAADPAGPSGQQQPRKKKKRGQKSYVVLPNFVPTSATSFDRFAGQVSNIIRAMPGMAERVMVSTFHPEHVTDGTRAPVPIMVITWK